MINIIKENTDDIQLINLTEARRHPDLNPKISAYDALKPYSDDDYTYISFTKLDKIGLNPGSHYNTPIGIYTYPLKAAWKEYNIDQLRSVGKAVPFVGESPYVWLLELRKGTQFINDMYTGYGSNDYDEDMDVLRSNKEVIDAFYGQTDKLEEYILKWTNEARFRNPISSMWNVTRELGNLFASHKRGKGMVQWNYILRKILGYDGFADKSGRGIIHPAEPVQAVFLHRGAFEVIGQFFNKDYDRHSDATWNGDIWYGGIWEEGTWKGGTWEDGTWKDGTWKDGTWKNGTWINGIWVDGTWKDGVWEKGQWEDGIWEKGRWEYGTWKNGTWKKGIWIYGIWEKGKWEYGTWKNGLWEDGTWKNGIWEDGEWEDGTWMDGTWIDGTWINGVWEYGTWNNGTWKKGIWRYGIWEKGKWEYGTWKNGLWIDGTWIDGVWEKGIIHDPNKIGNYEPDWKWKGEYVVSPISPAEYFSPT